MIPGPELICLNEVNNEHEERTKLDRPSHVIGLSKSLRKPRSLFLFSSHPPSLCQTNTLGSGLRAGILDIVKPDSGSQLVTEQSWIKRENERDQRESGHNSG